jgi:hypothetical protein
MGVMKGVFAAALLAVMPNFSIAAVRVIYAEGWAGDPYAAAYWSQLNVENRCQKLGGRQVGRSQVIEGRRFGGQFRVIAGVRCDVP